MKKLSILLTAAMLICMLAACGSGSSSGEPESSKSEGSSQSSEESKEESIENSRNETPQTDVLYAVLGPEYVREYSIEYTGDKNGPEELANELSELTGLDFFITASRTDDGWIVDWSADSTLVAGLDGREHKEEFFFYDANTLNWFMMDSLWRTITENLGDENVYYTMDGGQTLVPRELYPISKIPSDSPYMGSEFYKAHSDVQGEDFSEAYQGVWKYPNGPLLEINGTEWNLYRRDGSWLDGGSIEYDNGCAYLMNSDGSSGGGRVYFDEDNNLVDSDTVLTYYGDSI